MKANLTFLFHPLGGNTFGLTQWSNDQYKHICCSCSMYIGDQVQDIMEHPQLHTCLSIHDLSTQ